MHDTASPCISLHSSISSCCSWLQKECEISTTVPRLFSRSTYHSDLAALEEDESKVSLSQTPEEFTVQMSQFQGAREGAFEVLAVTFLRSAVLE